jgi:hypothetical protein
MKVNDFKDSVATIELTWGEVGMVNNALNEVCNGIHLEGEFDTRMGCTIEEARGLLEAMHNLGVSMERKVSE